MYCKHWEFGAYGSCNVGREMEQLIPNVNEERIGAPPAHFLNGDFWDTIYMHGGGSSCS